MQVSPIPLILMAAFSAACAQAPGPQPVPIGSRSGAEAGPSRATLAALVGEARCDSDTQCRTLPVGASPCGGPEGYLAWSANATDAAALAAEAERYAAARRNANQRSGRVGTCVFLDDPGAYCAPSGRCELKGTRGRPGSGAR